MSSTDASTEHTRRGSKTAAISNLVVRTMSDYTGRGPTQAQTHISDDVVTVVLRDTLTKGERSLVSEGLDGLVLTTREAFQSTMREELIRGVETILERKVVAFLNDSSVDPDMAVDVFVLEP